MHLVLVLLPWLLNAATGHSEIRKPACPLMPHGSHQADCCDREVHVHHTNCQSSSNEELWAVYAAAAAY